MAKLNFKIELSETDIKIAIAEYIGKKYGMSMYTNGNFQKVKLKHIDDTVLLNDGTKQPIAIYNAIFECEGND